MLSASCSSLPGIVAIYRFGSWDTPQVWSDSGIAQIASRDVDLVDMRSASTVIRLQIIAHGERIYCADEATANRSKLRFTPGMRD